MVKRKKKVSKKKTPKKKAKKPAGPRRKKAPALLQIRTGIKTLIEDLHVFFQRHASSEERIFGNLNEIIALVTEVHAKLDEPYEGEEPEETETSSKPEEPGESRPLTVTVRAESPDDIARLRRMMNADKAYRALFEIQQEVFRPARKHGYSDLRIQEALEMADRSEVLEPVGAPFTTPAGTELVSRLEGKFWEILEKNGIDMDDYY